MDTYSTNCGDCGEEMDFVIGTGEKPICDDCLTSIEAEKEKNDNYFDDIKSGLSD